MSQGAQPATQARGRTGGSRRSETGVDRVEGGQEEEGGAAEASVTPTAREGLPSGETTDHGDDGDGEGEGSGSAPQFFDSEISPGE